jgi:transcriptional regulator with XRE-family HTH domain
MNTRLKQFLSAENISQSQFADTIKVVRASVSHVLAGRNNPSYDFIKAIMDNYPSLNIEWLMLGKGKMYKDPNSSIETLESPAQKLDFDVEPGLLFNDFSEDIPEPAENFKFLSETKEANNTSQPSVKQRSITKILVLFDDGSFQEI